MKKVLFTAIFFVFFVTNFFSQNTSPRLKEIKMVTTNFKNKKDGEIINKNFQFLDGKLQNIQTSDVIQKFFYNTQGLLDMTVKEKVGSNWKEVANYTYDTENRLVKYQKKYDENGESVTKIVKISYENARIKVLTTKGNSNQKFVSNIEYIVNNGTITRKSTRDRNDQILNKIEYQYQNDNLSNYRNLMEDKAVMHFVYDDKNSVNALILQNLFGENYKVIVPIMAMHEEELQQQAISAHNQLVYKPSSVKYTGTTAQYKYNTNNYPIFKSTVEENGIVKTQTNYVYE